MMPHKFTLLGLLTAALTSCTPSLDNDGCSQTATLHLSAVGGTHQVGLWKFQADPGALSGPIQVSVSTCPGQLMTHRTLIGAQNKVTGEVTLEPIDLEPLSEYGPIKIAIDSIENVKNPDGLFVCPQASGKHAIKSLIVDKRLDDQNHPARPDLTSSPHEKCYYLVDPGQTQGTLILSATTGIWDSITEALSKGASKLKDLIISKTAFLMDTCGACTYVGTVIGSQPNLCAKLAGGQICETALTLVPVANFPPVKQILCSIANNAINTTFTAIGGAGSKPQEICENFVPGLQAFEDLLTCDFHWGCHYVGLCASSEGQSDLKLLQDIEAKCETTCETTYQVDTNCCANESCFKTADKCKFGNENDCENAGCDWNPDKSVCEVLAPADLCPLITKEADCKGSDECKWSGTACVKKT